MTIIEQIRKNVIYINRIQADIEDTEIDFANGLYYASNQMFIELKEALEKIQGDLKDIRDYGYKRERYIHPLQIMINRTNTLIDTCKAYIK